MQTKAVMGAVAAIMLMAMPHEPLNAAKQEAKPIEITAKRFQFTPNEVTVKVNEPAVLVFKSEDVTHGMHFDDLDINVAIAKGTGAEAKFTPTKTGDYVGHCAVFCGTGHGNMSLTIHVVE